MKFGVIIPLRDGQNKASKDFSFGSHLQKLLDRKAKSNLAQAGFFSRSVLKVLSLGLLIAASMYCFSLPMAYFAVLAIITIGGMTRLNYQINQDKNLLEKNPKQWITRNGKAYDMGNKSKDWLPYASSCFATAAYGSAYQIGLEDGLAQRNLRNKLK